MLEKDLDCGWLQAALRVQSACDSHPPPSRRGVQHPLARHDERHRRAISRGRQLRPDGCRSVPRESAIPAVFLAVLCGRPPREVHGKLNRLPAVMFCHFLAQLPHVPTGFRHADDLKDMRDERFQTNVLGEPLMVILSMIRPWFIFAEVLGNVGIEGIVNQFHDEMSPPLRAPMKASLPVC